MKPFLQGKKSSTQAPLRAPVAGARAPAGKDPQPAPAPAASSATVEVVKEGDKVVRLIVSCVCGERVEIECLYPPGG